MTWKVWRNETKEIWKFCILEADITAIKKADLPFHLFETKTYKKRKERISFKGK
jgi:hypothetical protein